MTSCPHDDDPLTCPPCLLARHPELRDSRHLASGSSIIARYDSECSDCGGMMYAGDEITQGENGWMHADHVDAWGG